jgi:hypothetical protein
MRPSAVTALLAICLALDAVLIASMFIPNR